MLDQQRDCVSINLVYHLSIAIYVAAVSVVVAVDVDNYDGYVMKCLQPKLFHLMNF